jgi:hypothetical protein
MIRGDGWRAACISRRRDRWRRRIRYVVRHLNCPLFMLKVSTLLLTLLAGTAVDKETEKAEPFDIARYRDSQVAIWYRATRKANLVM